MSTAQPIRSNDELNLFKEFYLNNRPNVRNYALICIGLNSALRISDVLQLRWEDVYDFKNEHFLKHIIIIEKKTNKETRIAINDKSEMKYIGIGVQNIRGDLLLDDFSLTVKGGTSGIETTTANQTLPVKVDGGELYVGGVKGSRITVYDAIGRTVTNTVATSETTHISNLPKNQLLVVKAGNKTAKVMMR